MIKYRKHKYIIQGSHGSVFEGSIEDSDEVKYAIKSYLGQVNYDRSYSKELDLLRRMEHPNIVRIEDFYFEGGRANLVFPLYNRTLNNAIASSKEFPLSRRVKYMKDIINGFSFLFSHKISHCDIKPENIMIDNSCDNDDIIIIDFSLSVEISSVSKNNERTAVAACISISPEFANKRIQVSSVLKTSGISIPYEIINPRYMDIERSNYYSLGVILLDVYRWKLVNSLTSILDNMRLSMTSFDERKSKIISLINQNNPLKEEIDDQLVDFITSLLECDPEERERGYQKVEYIAEKKGEMIGFYYREIGDFPNVRDILHQASIKILILCKRKGLDILKLDKSMVFARRILDFSLRYDFSPKCRNHISYMIAMASVYLTSFVFYLGNDPEILHECRSELHLFMTKVHKHIKGVSVFDRVSMYTINPLMACYCMDKYKILSQNGSSIGFYVNEVMKKEEDWNSALSKSLNIKKDLLDRVTYYSTINDKLENIILAIFRLSEADRLCIE